MKKKSLKQFLKEYLVQLSYQNTINIKKLCAEADSNPRLYEVLFLHCTLSNKEKLLLKYASDETKKRYSKYKKLFGDKENEDLELALDAITKDKKLTLKDSDYYYGKVYQAYKVDRDSKDRDYKEKIEMRDSIKKLKEELKVSDYQLCKENKVNPGNFHAFMYKGEDNKLGYWKVAEVFGYLFDLKRAQ